MNGQSGVFQVDEKHSATLNIDTGHYDVAKNYEPNPNDNWDKQQSEYHDRYTASNSYRSSPYAYGMSDLSYYGRYSSYPGYGMVWQPYFMDANWSPFQDGGWVFYPGVGYTWVSSYPWGWTPYRYGNWAFIPGFGDLVEKKAIFMKSSGKLVDDVSVCPGSVGCIVLADLLV